MSMEGKWITEPSLCGQLRNGVGGGGVGLAAFQAQQCPLSLAPGS